MTSYELLLLLYLQICFIYYQSTNSFESTFFISGILFSRISIESKVGIRSSMKPFKQLSINLIF